MQIRKSDLDLDPLVEAVRALDYWHDASGIDMTHTQGGGIPKWAAASGPIARAVDEIRSITGKRPVSVMVNRLEPGASVGAHIDQEDHGDRWHLPIVTNSEAFWWDDNGGFAFLQEGVWYGPVPYRIPHRVGNPGDTERIHLVVDLR